MKLSNNTLREAIAMLLFILPYFYSFGQTSPEQEIEQYAQNISGNVGVYALLIETGETVSYQADQRFPMQSVYKFPIAMAVLDQVDKGKLSLDQVIQVLPSDYIPEQGYSPIREKFPKGVELTIRELLDYTIRSDGSASDVLLKTVGGAEAADQYVSNLGIGDEDMAIALPEKIQVANDTIQYQNYSTPRAMTELLKTFCVDSVLSEASQALLFQDMIDSKTGLGRIKGLLPKGTIVAHKTGTSATYNGLTRATNDAGIIVLPNGNHLAISVFVSDSYASDKERDRIIANVAKAVFDYWRN
ncbi:class A beta-lactamase [Tunicatimonas pelagia]|uniref:class A beta-lactamase n=1 Tax=Tunicatimonas pelagia TaxID=931531 RepID=UPI0026667A88|nr:class A beta-lactamase [Tunicatimonas pelagia]WKN44648.1 class A beta-lactamase [Tunicatimonas pelagia]